MKASGPITSWQIDGEKGETGETVETVTDYFLGSKITADGDCSHEIKRLLLLGRKVMTNLDSILKSQRHYFANKGPSSQGYGFFSSHIWMWELDYKESWVLNNWCFCSVCWRRLLRVLGTARRSNQGNQSWIFIGRTDVETETLILCPPDAKSWLTGKDPDAGKDWGQEEKRMTEDEVASEDEVGWHHRLSGHEFE